MKRLAQSLTIATAGLATACSTGGAPDSGPSGRLAVGVAPLTLAGVSDACWDLRVKQGALPGTGLVWQQLGLCSSRFGNDQGSLTYIGTCDATAPAGQVAKNTVELVLQSLWTGGTSTTGTELDDYRNPCPSTAPCRLDAECRENADSKVEFNITVARAANQGFFDVAVNFEDIFCSAKVDCNDADGNPIELLHNPGNEGRRDATLVAAFACYSGANQTILHMTDALIECPDLTYIVAPSAGTGGLLSPLGPEDEVLFAASVYEGFEPQAGTGLAYWNLALGIDEAALPATGCTFRIRATASESSWPTGYIPPSFTTYPVIAADVPLEIVDGNLFCGIHPLDGPGSKVITTYQPTGPLVGEPFCHELQSDNEDELTVALPGCGVTNTFPAAFGGNPIVLFDGQLYRAEVPPGAFVDAQGNPATGIIRMEASDTGLPGSGLIADATPEEHVVANFDFYDADGNLLQVAPGQSVTIFMPVPDHLLLAVQVGDSVPVHYYDPGTDSWIFETNGTFVDVGGRRYLRATVTHFTSYGWVLTEPSCQLSMTATVSGGELDPTTRFYRHFDQTPPPDSPAGYPSTIAGVPFGLTIRNGSDHHFALMNNKGYATSCVLTGAGTGTADYFTCTPSKRFDPLGIACTISLSTCGNGQSDTGEDCDGGPNCESDCTCPSDMIPDGLGGCTLCGNGVVDAGEDCDPLDNDNLDCQFETCTCDPTTTLYNGFCYQADGVLVTYLESSGATPHPATEITISLNGADSAGTFGSSPIFQVSDLVAGQSYSVSVSNSRNYDISCNLSGAASGDASSFTYEPTTPGDAVNINCTMEVEACGNQQLDGSETCDDEDDANCTSGCECAIGYAGDGMGGCQPDLDGVCSSNDNDLDCDGKCDPADEAGSPDCDATCDTSDLAGSPDCNGTCDSFAEQGSPDCDEVCQPGDASGGPDCDGYCGSWLEDGSDDCNGACALGDAANSPDCDGICAANDATDGPDCDTLCDTGDAADGPDCNGACEGGETGPDCDGFCNFADTSDSIDCTGSCQAGDEAGSPDCDNRCGSHDAADSVDCDEICGEEDEGLGPDCDGVCAMGDSPLGPDCDTFCDASETSDSPDCDSYCSLGDAATGPDCDAICQFGEDGPDCNGVCDLDDQVTSNDCDLVCDVDDAANGPDCNGVCVFGEEGSADCDGRCDFGEEGSADCDGVCDLDDGTVLNSSPDCDGNCDVDDAAGSLDCNGVCGPLDAAGSPDCDGRCDTAMTNTSGVADESNSPDCDGYCGVDDAPNSHDCDGYCGADDLGGSADCDTVCNWGDAANGPDCDGRCDQDDDSTSDDCDQKCDPDDYQLGNDCDDYCQTGEPLGTNDCDGYCGQGDSAGSVDCDGTCDQGDVLYSADCDGTCDPGDSAGSDDCNGVCAAGEENSADCGDGPCGNGVADPGEECEVALTGGWHPCVDDPSSYQGAPVCTCSDGFGVDGLCMPFGMLELVLYNYSGADPVGSWTFTLEADGDVVASESVDEDFGMWTWYQPYEEMVDGVEYRLSFAPALPDGTTCMLASGSEVYADLQEDGSEWLITYDSSFATNVSPVVGVRCDIPEP